ncbi:MAG: hypothetical protein ACTSU7_01885 [Candidatus Heimdallarchaeaceae archaeon]
MGNSINLLNLVPNKFRDSQILIDYLAALGNKLTAIDSTDKLLYNVSHWLDLIDNLKDFFDPEKVDITYLRNLAKLIDLDLLPEDTTTESILRASVVEAIDWYKIKGTYKSLIVIGLINQVDFNIWDMYTDADYNTFNKVEWFVGGENENPTDYPYASGYFKSPHFGLEVILNKVYDADADIGAPYNHLWHNSYWLNIQEYVEKTRPVHTVPHYSLFLNPQTNENGEIITVDGDIQTKATLNWVSGLKYFDENAAYDSSEGSEIADWTFDEDVDSAGDADYNFDNLSGITTQSIDTWKLGTGSKGRDLDESGWTDIEDECPTEGSISQSDIAVTSETVTIEFTIPKTTILSGVSELGIYTNGGEANETLVVASLFPDIWKSTESELRIQIIIERE